MGAIIAPQVGHDLVRKDLIFAFVLAIATLCVGQDSGSQSQERLAVGEHRADIGGIHFWYKVAGKGPLLVVQAPCWGAGSE